MSCDSGVEAPSGRKVDLRRVVRTALNLMALGCFLFAIGCSNASSGGASSSENLPAVCGNGVVEPQEQCDDGNLEGGDGCSADCRIEDGWECRGNPSICTEICGDGIVVGNEDCDDRNDDPLDGCDNCRFGSARLTDPQNRTIDRTAGRWDLDIGSDGRFVVVWTKAASTLGESGGRIYGQRFGENGQRHGGVFVVSSKVRREYAFPVATAMLPGGRFVVTWDERRDDDSNVDIIRLLVFDFDTLEKTSLLSVPSSADPNTVRQENPDVAAMPNGEFVVVWAEHSSCFYFCHVRAQRFSPEGNWIGEEFSVAESGRIRESPAIDSNDSGEYVVVWKSKDMSEGSIKAQRFSSQDTKIGNELSVDSKSSYYVVRPDVAVGENGEFAVAWQAGNGDTTGRIGLQLFRKSGEKVGQEIEVTRAKDVSWPSISVSPNGNYGIVNMDVGTVWLRRFYSTGIPGSDSVVIGEGSDSPDAKFGMGPVLSTNQQGKSVIVWKKVGVGPDGESQLYITKFDKEWKQIGYSPWP